MGLRGTTRTHMNNVSDHCIESIMKSVVFHPQFLAHAFCEVSFQIALLKKYIYFAVYCPTSCYCTLTWNMYRDSEISHVKVDLGAFDLFTFMTTGWPASIYFAGVGVLAYTKALYFTFRRIMDIGPGRFDFESLYSRSLKDRL